MALSFPMKQVLCCFLALLLTEELVQAQVFSSEVTFDGSPKDQLLSVKSQLIAALSGQTRRKSISNLASCAVETVDPEVIRAHIEFESGVLSLVNRKRTDAFTHFEKAENILKDVSPRGEEWLRRASVTRISHEIWELKPLDYQAYWIELEDCRKLILSHPLPSNSGIPRKQLTIEAQIMAATDLKRLAQHLKGNSCDIDTAIRESCDLLKQIYEMKVLNESLFEDSAGTPYEQVIDETALDTSAFDATLFEATQSLEMEVPDRLRSIWIALTSLWYTELDIELNTSAQDQILAGIAKNNNRLLVSAFGSLLEVAQKFNFPDTIRRSGKFLVEVRPDQDSDLGEKLIIADTLIEGGRGEVASRFLNYSHSDPFSDDIEGLRVKKEVFSKNFTIALALIEKHPSLLRSGETSFWIGKAYMGIGRQKDARTTLLIFLDTNPTSRRAPEAALLIALISSNLHDRELAIKYFNIVTSKYPRSKEALRAMDFLTYE